MPKTLNIDHFAPNCFCLSVRVAVPVSLLERRWATATTLLYTCYSSTHECMPSFGAALTARNAAPKRPPLPRVHTRTEANKIIELTVMPSVRAVISINFIHRVSMYISQYVRQHNDTWDRKIKPLLYLEQTPRCGINLQKQRTHTHTHTYSSLIMAHSHFKLAKWWKVLRIRAIWKLDGIEGHGN